MTDTTDTTAQTDADAAKALAPDATADAAPAAPDAPAAPGAPAAPEVSAAVANEDDTLEPEIEAAPVHHAKHGVLAGSKQAQHSGHHRKD